MKKGKLVYLVLITFFLFLGASWEKSSQPESSLEQDYEFESCTSIFAGRLATVDGSTITSHSCDSGSDRTWINIVPHQKHKKGEMCKIYLKPKNIKGPDDPDRFPVGKIPQVSETYSYMNAA